MLPEAHRQTAAAAAQPESGQAVRAGEKGALREQRISGVLGPFSSSKSLALASVMSSERL
eukprot:COSAG02_NODE_83_length_39665_cov_25.213719_26_plen_60_part_00